MTSFEPFTGQTTVNQGTLRLSAGTNTLIVGVATTGNPLVVNAGGTLDLNGNVQMVSTLSSTGAAIGLGINGGTITSGTGAGTLVTTTGAASWGGTISGSNVNFIRSGAASTVLTILNPQTYGGTTVINGGGNDTTTTSTTLNGVTLADYGFLASTNITLNYASLNLNNGTASLTDSSSRLSNSAAITMNGGGLDFIGRAGSYSNQAVGAVTLTQGVSVISAADQSNVVTGPDSATLTLASLTVNHANGVTVAFAQNWQNNSAGTLGLIQDGSGHSENIFITAAPTLTNNILGGWAVAPSTSGYQNYTPVELASYNAVTGVGALNTAGFAGYDATTIPSVLAKRPRTSAWRPIKRSPPSAAR